MIIRGGSRSEHSFKSLSDNANLEQKVQAKNFREDLYYRQNLIPIHKPALRQHNEDIHTEPLPCDRQARIKRRLVL